MAAAHSSRLGRSLGGGGGGGSVGEQKRALATTTTTPSNRSSDQRAVSNDDDDLETVTADRCARQQRRCSAATSMATSGESRESLHAQGGDYGHGYCRRGGQKQTRASLSQRHDNDNDGDEIVESAVVLAGGSIG